MWYYIIVDLLLLISTTLTYQINTCATEFDACNSAEMFQKTTFGATTGPSVLLQQ